MSGFGYKEFMHTGYFTIDEFENTGVKACFSARIGGISPSPYNTMNLGYKSGDIKENIDSNFDILCGAAGFKKEDLVLSDQVHSNRCRVVGEADRGKGVLRESDIKSVDGLTTNAQNTALCIFTADCVPVFLYDRVKDAVALCHAGWRGIVSGIIGNTIDTMVKAYGTKPSDLIAAIGPSIGPCCFNVGYDVVKTFKNVFGDLNGIIIEEEGRYRINLWSAADSMLRDAGLRPEGIVNSALCTSCRGDLFYSYRRDGSLTGRMISIIQL